jgi:hypothetical protein
VYLRNFLILFFILTVGLYAPFVYANSESSLSSKNIEKSIAPFQNISEKELLITLKENTKTSYLAPVLERYPLVGVFIVRMVKDKEALPFLAKILEDHKRLLRYLYWLIGLFIIGIIARRLLINREAHFFIRFMQSLFCFTMMLSARLFITYTIFAKELDPTIKVFKRSFF